MLVGVPCIDYVRLSSFDEKAIAAFHQWVVDLGDGEVNDRAGWNQYKGRRCGEFFAGVADQNGRLHGLFDAAGESSARVLPLAADWLDVFCKRLDVQVTVPLEAGYRARDFKDALESAKWKRERKVRMIEGPTKEGLDTVYIGARVSGRYGRVYVKLDAENRRYVRFEMEFKDDLAGVVYERLLTGGDVGEVLRGEYERIPAVAVDAWRSIGLVLAEWQAADGISVPRSRGNGASRYAWFADTVMPAVDELLNDHAYGAKVAHLLVEAVRERGFIE